jgi:hypothetical protein
MVAILVLLGNKVLIIQLIWHILQKPVLLELIMKE